mmetsp:Transcript_70740/g.160022  ORF Transcript_70740/g.160022 Transcript_70740/m.160022 type:complete len:288 (-) Transcript_70740:117-980(-)
MPTRAWRTWQSPDSTRRLSRSALERKPPITRAASARVRGRLRLRPAVPYRVDRKEPLTKGKKRAYPPPARPQRRNCVSMGTSAAWTGQHGAIHHRLMRADAKIRFDLRCPRTTSCWWRSTAMLPAASKSKSEKSTPSITPVGVTPLPIAELGPPGRAVTLTVGGRPLSSGSPFTRRESPTLATSHSRPGRGQTVASLIVEGAAEFVASSGPPRSLGLGLPILGGGLGGRVVGGGICETLLKTRPGLPRRRGLTAPLRFGAWGTTKPCTTVLKARIARRCRQAIVGMR